MANAKSGVAKAMTKAAKKTAVKTASPQKLKTVAKKATAKKAGVTTDKTAKTAKTEGKTDLSAGKTVSPRLRVKMNLARDTVAKAFLPQKEMTAGSTAVSPVSLGDRQNSTKTAKTTGKAKSALTLPRKTPGLSSLKKTASSFGSDLTYLPVGDFKISSRYGVDRVTHRHSGIDLAVPEGTKVAAAKSGKVSFAGWGNGYGYRVVIDHPDGTQTTYNHLSDIGVDVGQEVRAGTTVALSGNTGHSTGPHLHFEVKVNGQYADPEDFFDFSGGRIALQKGDYISKQKGKGNTLSASAGSGTKKGSGSSGKSSARSAAKGTTKTKAKTVVLPKMEFTTSAVFHTPAVAKVTPFERNKRGRRNYYNSLTNLVMNRRMNRKMPDIAQNR